MSAPVFKLFTQPNFVWTDIRQEEEAHRWMSRTFESMSTVNQCIGFTAFNVLTPEYLRATVS